MLLLRIFFFIYVHRPTTPPSSAFVISLIEYSQPSIILTRLTRQEKREKKIQVLAITKSSSTLGIAPELLNRILQFLFIFWRCVPRFVYDYFLGLKAFHECSVKIFEALVLWKTNINLLIRQISSNFPPGCIEGLYYSCFYNF